MQIEIDQERFAKIDGRATCVPAAARFWSSVKIARGCACWPWLGRRDAKGYGRTSIGGRKNIGAHRKAWELTNGVIPEGLQVLHRCDNPSCVNPNHLFLGTNHDNILDRHTKGRSKNIFQVGEQHPARQRRGEAHWCAKLNAEAVREIRTRRAAGETTTSLAAVFGVNSGTISRIVRREWRGEVE